MIPLSSNEKGGFGFYNIFNDTHPSRSNYNHSLPSTSNQHPLTTQGELNNVMNTFKKFNSFNDNSLNQLNPYIAPKDSMTRNIQLSNVLPDTLTELMNIIKIWKDKIACIDQQESSFTRKITLVFYDLRDSIKFYNDMEAFSSNFFSLTGLNKLNMTYCRDDIAASIFVLKPVSNFHKTEFYLTFLAPIHKLRNSLYMDYLKTFGDLKESRLINSDNYMTTISVEYFDSRITLSTSRILGNAIFKDFKMFVSFEYNHSKMIPFSPFDEEPLIFNRILDSQCSSLSHSSIITDTMEKKETDYQPLNQFSNLTFFSPPLPFASSSLDLKPSFSSTTASSNTISSCSSQERLLDPFSNLYLSDINPMLRTPSNTLLLAPFTPNIDLEKEVENTVKDDYYHPPVINSNHYHHHNGFQSISSNPIPLWPFVNNEDTTSINQTTNINSTTKENTFSSGPFLSLNTNQFQNISASTTFVKPLYVNHTEENEDYKVKVNKVKNGSDIRTTFMIRNIPNKYTLKMLREFLDATNKGTYDFLYLRFDFANQCNAGYAFINFIEPIFVVSFIEERIGKIWNKFNSEKLCDISYAKIQGKKNLVSKFKHSNVMKQSIEYRPIIFHSRGPNRGLEEPFPIGHCKEEKPKYTKSLQ